MRKSWWVLAAVGCGTFMATLDTSIVNVALPTITQDLDSTLGEVRWVIIAYMLAITCLLLPAGKLADQFGRKRIFQAGYLVFTAGSALCAVSQDIVSLVVSRIIQGVGASFLMANGPAIITQAFPAEVRGSALGIMGMVVSVGLVTGPTLGGFLITHLPWNVIFAVNLPVGILGFAMAQLFVRTEHGASVGVAGARARGARSGSGRSGGRLRFDWLGFVLQSAFLISFIAAVDPPRFQSMVDQTRAVVTSSGMLHEGMVRWIAAGISGATGIAFLWQETRSRAPLLDMSLFGNATFGFSCLAAFFLFVGFSAVTVLMPFFLVEILELEPKKVGLLMSAIPIAIFVTSPISGWLSDRLGTRALSFTGTVIGALTLYAMAGGMGRGWAVDEGMSVTHISVFLALMGASMGFFQSPNNSAIMGSVPPARVGAASALMAAVRNLGMVVGTGLTTAIFLWRYEYTQGFVDSLQFTYWVAFGFGCFAAITTIAKRIRQFRKEQVTDDGHQAPRA